MGLFHLFHLNQSSTMARKILTHKKHVEGFEAPRNSLELQLEACQSNSTATNCAVEEDWPEKDCYPFDVSMKRLINEEISRQPRKNSPSIVARLMGVDMLPIDTKSAAQQVDGRNGTKQSKTEKNEAGLFFSKSGISKKVEFESLNEYNGRDFEIWEKGENIDKPRPREHPQEEELQKFKKEFEAWQAARFKECSKVVELEKENINKQQVARNENSATITSEKSVLKEKYNGRLINRNYEACSIDYDENFGEYFAPKRIVILKPGPDRICDPKEDSWPSSSCTAEDRGSIEDFLEEVKERLKHELQGKSRKTSRGSGIETPFREKPSDPKKIAQHIAKQVRDSVTRNLVRSESTRSYGSEIQIDGPDSPEFINRNARKFLAERLRNVTKKEKHSQDVPFAEVKETRIVPRCEEHVMRTRSFRNVDDDVVIHRELSPRNLVRSLSAPVSGTSFGKLLLEDRHILTGAHIRRKHESLENLKDFQKPKKERFNIKEKVSNFKYSLTLRGKLFSKKIQSMVESNGFEQDFAKDIMGRPLVRNFSERHVMENSTEVPPSPASVCSSVLEDFWRPLDYSSPLSTHDVTPAEDCSIPQVFKEISSNLNELRRQLNQLESNEPDNSKTKLETDDFTMVDLEDKVEAYVRDLLVASGLYDGSFDPWLSRWDPLAKPISKSVFEKLEQKHSESVPDKDRNDHKLVYDLLNETVAMLIGPPVTTCRFRWKIISSSFLPPLRGRKLLECVWEMMKVYLNPPRDKSRSSLDSMVAENIKTSPWSGLIDDEINGFAKDIESEIMKDLVQEILTGFVRTTATAKAKH